jgi:hypothetical protein
VILLRRTGPSFTRRSEPAPIWDLWLSSMQLDALGSRIHLMSPTWHPRCALPDFRFIKRMSRASLADAYVLFLLLLLTPMSARRPFASGIRSVLIPINHEKLCVGFHQYSKGFAERSTSEVSEWSTGTSSVYADKRHR